MAPHGLSAIFQASARTVDPAPSRPPDPLGPVGALSAWPVRPRRPARREMRAAGSLPQTRRHCRALRTHGRRPCPHPLRVPGEQASGGRGAGNGHGGRRRTPAVLPSRRATRPRPTCAPAPAGAWPGAAHPDAAAAAAAGGLACPPTAEADRAPSAARRSPTLPTKPICLAKTA